MLTRRLLIFGCRQFSSSGSSAASGGGGGVVDWTKPGKVLSVEQKKAYERDGFIVVKNVVDKAELKKFEDRFIAFCERKATPPKSILMMKDVSIAKKVTEESIDTITKIQYFADDPILISYCELPSITDIVRDLVGNPNTKLQAMHTMLINKPPDTGKLTSRHPMHQDMIYFPWTPADLTICAWTAMEKINQENGCLQVVPGTHKLGLKEHTYPDWEGGVNKTYYCIKNYDLSIPRKYVEMEAGDTVFFHPYLYHGSGVNRSQGFRKAISCHYANYDLSRYIDVTGTIQEEIANQVLEVFKQRPDRYKISGEKDPTYELTFRRRAHPVNHFGRENL